jgi:hypothetical protein
MASGQVYAKKLASARRGGILAQASDVISAFGLPWAALKTTNGEWKRTRPNAFFASHRWDWTQFPSNKNQNFTLLRMY